MEVLTRVARDMGPAARGTKQQAQDYCDGSTFWCDKGHCCGKGKCCAYYYELWWFWLIWALVILLSCCCLYQQKRFRHRRQSTRHSSRSRPRNRLRIDRLIDAAFATPIFDTDRVRLPTYDEAKDMPKDPPPYDMLYETRLPETSVVSQQNDASQIPPSTSVNEAPQASLIDNEERSDVAVSGEAWREPPPPYTLSLAPPTPHPITMAPPQSSIISRFRLTVPAPQTLSPSSSASQATSCPIKS